TGASGGKVVAAGTITQNPIPIPPPPSIGPPNIPQCPSTGCIAASPTSPCTNGTHTAAGSPSLSNCYNPGAYTTIGLPPDFGIHNNLNPGIYHITGDTSSICYSST